MFTLKFYRQDGAQETVVSAMWYEVFGIGSRKSIIIHTEMPCANGVGFEISTLTGKGSENHFYECYIENAKGKTIAAYKAAPNDLALADEISGD